MCKVIAPVNNVVSALINNIDQGPIKNEVIKKSAINGLYTVSNNKVTTIGTKLCFKSCLDQSQTKVDVVMC